jgi:hypothetical protein
MIASLPRRVARAASALAILALTVPFVDCRKGPDGGKALRRAKERVFVMGFDGMDPTLARKWMDEGKLPNLKALADEGTFARLGSTQPSESPTAWSSFATGVNSGEHSIYDFLVRDLQTYFPDLNMVRRPKEPPRYEESNPGFNGYLERLLFDAGVSETFLRGPQSPVLWHVEAALKQKKKAGNLSDKEQARLDEVATGKDINVPMTVRWTEGAGRADVEMKGHRLSLKAGQWSEWVPRTFQDLFGRGKFSVRKLLGAAIPADYDSKPLW